eukprot:scaffold8287_cov36-Tisochrysis_lutea.AAC.3
MARWQRAHERRQAVAHHSARSHHARSQIHKRVHTHAHILTHTNANARSRKGRTVKKICTSRNYTVHQGVIKTHNKGGGES